MEQEDSKGTKNCPGSTNPEGSSNPELSGKNTPRSLKAKSKIVKKSKAGKLKTKTDNGPQQLQVKKRLRKNKKVVGNTDEPPKSPEAEKSMEKEGENRSNSDKSSIQKRHQAQKNKIIETNKNDQKKKIKENHQAKKSKIIEMDKNDQKNSEKRREPNKGARRQANKDKHVGMENTESSEKKREKLGGFIFMCNAKTKPDCFHYRVMGVSAAKKDMVLGVKPGMKLFLYDFDLKLLYGIYKATSSGGMKLEPRAFSGNFPAQVRFNVASDCFPIPESIFKKAIKENYNEKNKFKTELTVRQVRKLTELFRPVDVRSALQPVGSPPKVTIRDREATDGVRGSWRHSHRERAAGDPYTNSNMNSYHERDPRMERQEEIPHDLFLTEKSYRAYGLHGDRRNMVSASQVNAITEPYERDYEREHLHHLDPIYRNNVPPAHVESLRGSSHHLNEGEHQPYFHGSISDHTDDPYHAYRYGTSPRDPYFPPKSREEMSSRSYFVGGGTLIGTDNLQRREPIPDRLYSTYSAADALSEYNRMQQYHPENLEATNVPVSSRYTFAGPSSYSLR